jgi:hypothetical protein
MKSKYFNKLCLITLLSILISITPVMASMTLTGVKFMENAAPNTTVTFPMTLSLSPNDTATTYQITVFGFNNTPEGNYIGINPPLDTSVYSARPFLTLDADNVTVKPGESKTVTATLKVPETATGGLYALINIHPRSSDITSGTSVVTAMNVPVMITITNTSQVKNGRIDKIETDTHGNFTTYITNTGNIHYYGISNTISIVNESGAQVAQSTSESLITAVVPGGSVKISQHMTLNLPSGTYKANAYMIDSNKTVIATGTVPFAITKIPTPTTTKKSPVGIELIIASIICTICVIKSKQNS